VSDSEDDF